MTANGVMALICVGIGMAGVFTGGLGASVETWASGYVLLAVLCLLKSQDR